MYLNLFLILAFDVIFPSAHKFRDSDKLNRLIVKKYKLLTLFEVHIAEYQKKLDALKLKVLEFKNNNEKGINSDETYFLNPINRFSCTRRLAVDWDEIEELIFNDSFLSDIQSFKNFSNFPTKLDLKSSVSALFFLQDIYNLLPSSLVKGEINEVDFNTSLNERDCFDLGFTAYNDEDYYHSILWMNAALNNLIDPNNEKKEIILDILTESFFRIGHVDNATEPLKVSSDQLSQIAKQFYETTSSKITETLLNKFPSHLYKGLLSTNSNFPKLCRDVQNSENANLNCYYENNNIPFLFIGPFKKEILNIDPLLVIFHDVISDEEINSSQNIVKNNLVYSTVYLAEQNKDIVVKGRNSKDKWIESDEQTKYQVNLQKRVADITALNSQPTMLNVNSYEIGGYYLPHYDFFKGEGFAYGDLNGTGGRIATLIFYMNDVLQGGATVFPDNNISFLPKKGSAIFWYNLYSSGQEDFRTLHGGCPVLVGSKWISTFWIHEKFQDIHRPCVETSRVK